MIPLNNNKMKSDINENTWKMNFVEDLIELKRIITVIDKFSSTYNNSYFFYLSKIKQIIIEINTKFRDIELRIDESSLELDILIFIDGKKIIFEKNELISNIKLLKKFNSIDFTLPELNISTLSFSNGSGRFEDMGKKLDFSYR